MLELFEDGIRAALLSTAERSDQLGNWTEILEVGWLGTPSPAAVTSEAVEAKTAETSAGNAKGANLSFEIKSEVLRSLWWHCVYASPRVLRSVCGTHSLLIPTVAGPPLSVSNCSFISAASRTGANPSLRPRRRADSSSRRRLCCGFRMSSSCSAQMQSCVALSRQMAGERCVHESPSLSLCEEGGLRRIIPIQTILLVYLRITQGAPSPLPPPDELPPSVLYNPARGALVLLAEGSLADTVERLLR